MQNPVRFYITQNDDQAIVRSIPVQARVQIEQAPPPDATDVAPTAKPTERLKVSRLVRSAVKFGGSTR